MHVGLMEQYPSGFHLHTAVHLRNKVLSPTDAQLGKAIPLQAWAGPEGSRKLRLPDFKTIGT
jgi:hypothetical protein